MNVTYEKKKKLNDISAKYDTNVSKYKMNKASENDW